NGRCERKYVPVAVAPTGMASERAIQVAAGGASRVRREQHEVHGDRPQEDTAGTTPEPQRHPRHETQECEIAALLALGPVVAVHARAWGEGAGRQPLATVLCPALSVKRIAPLAAVTKLTSSGSPAAAGLGNFAESRRHVSKERS